MYFPPSGRMQWAGRKADIQGRVSKSGRKIPGMILSAWYF